LNHINFGVTWKFVRWGSSLHCIGWTIIA